LEKATIACHGQETCHAVTSLHPGRKGAPIRNGRPFETPQAPLFEQTNPPKTEVAEVKADVAVLKTEVTDLKIQVIEVHRELSERISALEVTMERGFRTMTFRLIGVFFALQALMLAALRFIGPA